jgi:hypothetical protein
MQRPDPLPPLFEVNTSPPAHNSQSAQNYEQSHAIFVFVDHYIKGKTSFTKTTLTDRLFCYLTTPFQFQRLQKVEQDEKIIMVGLFAM